MELRPLTVGRLLQIRREVLQTTEDSLEQAVWCNAQVLAESCWTDDQPAYASAEEVLSALTFPEMEELLHRLMEQPPASQKAGANNPNFHMEQFQALREGQR